MEEEKKSPCDIALEAAKKAELAILGDIQKAQLEAPQIKPEKKKRGYMYMRILITGGAKMKVRVNLTLDDATWEKFRIRAIQEKTSGSAIIDRLMGAYLGESPYPTRGRKPAQGKRAHAKAAKTAAGEARKAV